VDIEADVSDSDKGATTKSRAEKTRLNSILTWMIASPRLALPPIAGGARDMKTSAIRWIGAVSKKPLRPFTIAVAGPATLGMATAIAVFVMVSADLGQAL
jgi:hypothetical protein